MGTRILHNLNNSVKNSVSLAKYNDKRITSYSYNKRQEYGKQIGMYPIPKYKRILINVL